ncbi:hypothetical protein [Parendozoicomonas sp. Alg238-R29]|uniref:hypothetical protein n=1 Tax=Parendozoicomonas sp. Alg238-R29 TaxID=2993446 RepID=UPI00248F0750|nr:hypothetical protein [Parendozoicomonas sp. Alg238-R29]
MYLCHGCKLTPSLSITTSQGTISNEPLISEFKRVYRDVSTEPDLIQGHQRFHRIRASDPVTEGSPQRVTYLITRYVSPDTGKWHYVQVFIEASLQEDALAAEQKWLDLLTNAYVQSNTLELYEDNHSVHIDIAQPKTSLINSLVEKLGTNKIIAGGALVSTTAIVVFGVRVSLGAMGVRGPCGGNIATCKCTDVMQATLGVPPIH